MNILNMKRSELTEKLRDRGYRIGENSWKRLEKEKLTYSLLKTLDNYPKDEAVKKFNDIIKDTEFKLITNYKIGFGEYVILKDK